MQGSTIKMYGITCPECNRGFQVRYRNTGTYCQCKFPFGDLVEVPAFDTPEIEERKKRGAQLFRQLYPHLFGEEER